MSAPAPIRLVALLVLALAVGGPQTATGRADGSPAAVAADRSSVADPLRCPVTLLGAHRVRCDYLTGGTTVR
jgi:hypothetical protein